MEDVRAHQSKLSHVFGGIYERDRLKIVPVWSRKVYTEDADTAYMVQLYRSHAPIRCVDGVVLWHSPKALKRLAENNTGLKSQATAVSLVRGAVQRMNARMNSAEHGSRKEPAKCT